MRLGLCALCALFVLAHAQKLRGVSTRAASYD
jgi:hypothetical protein